MEKTKRNCVFTGRPSTSKLDIGEDTHNWARSVPCDKQFKELRKGECLSEDEMDAVALFYLIENHRVRIENLELELKKVQKKILEKIPLMEKEKTKKANEIEMALIQKDLQEEGRDAIEKVLEKKLKLWD